nr:MAG TPA: hypothetical protein [Caudoviricetes sp.]
MSIAIKGFKEVSLLGLCENTLIPSLSIGYKFLA